MIGRIDLLAVNEIEAAETAALLGVAVGDIPVPELLITRGSEGAEFHSGGKSHHQPAFAVNAVDTTGAGDTFLGSFMAHHATGAPVDLSLRYAAAASALQVTRAGAAIAIPSRDEVTAFLEQEDS